MTIEKLKNDFFEIVDESPKLWFSQEDKLKFVDEIERMEEKDLENLGGYLGDIKLFDSLDEFFETYKENWIDLEWNENRFPEYILNVAESLDEDSIERKNELISMIDDYFLNEFSLDENEAEQKLEDFWNSRVESYENDCNIQIIEDILEDKKELRGREV